MPRWRFQVMRALWNVSALCVIAIAGMNLSHAWGWPFDLTVGVIGSSAVLYKVFGNKGVK